MIPLNKIKSGMLIRSPNDMSSNGWHKENGDAMMSYTELSPSTLGMVIRKLKDSNAFNEHLILVEGKLYFINIDCWNIVEP